MAGAHPWTRQQLLIAFDLYCQLPFGRFHSRNPQIIEWATRLGRTPSALAMKLANIASVDPQFIATGRAGLAGASRSDKAMWEEMTQDWDGFAVAIEQAKAALSGIPADTNDVREKQAADYLGVDRLITAKARVGQTAFRHAVLSAYEHRCCISGLDAPELLIASHIVPWSAEAQHRKNPSNGLCLSALHDRAFDQGMICLDNEFKVQVSERLKASDNRFMSTSLLVFAGQPIQLPDKFQPDPAFIAYHREHIFMDNRA
ncbi:HNH endonuclease [Pokkaliibacter sp. CJK22405]|uniref:HNH endonuclease n=1 Tax=Pokkaliibacter sp. CJK22405 TaxID=3384615 RepID=UPI003984808D